MPSTPTDFTGLVQFIIRFIDLLIPLIFACTVLYIAWGIIRAWVINGGDRGSVDEGKKIALTGVVALVVMFGVWAILALLQSSLLP